MKIRNRDHQASCASLCTNWNGRDNSGPCEYGDHECWCEDGDMSYAAYRIKHPDVVESRSMTDEERRLFYLMADYIERKLSGEIGYISEAKPRFEEFEKARREAEDGSSS